MALLKALNRMLALVGKELVEVLRRPGVIASLVLGPFLVLAVFGLGYHGFKAEMQAIVVVPSDETLPMEPEAYAEFETRGIEIAEVTTDEAAARGKLADEAVDLMIVVPNDARERFEAGEQSEMQVVMNLTDPVQASYASAVADALALDVNRELYRLAAQEGKEYVLSVGGEQVAAVSPDVIASPIVANSENIAPTTPTILGFFGPAALALVLQHMAVALVALSVVRERQAGTMDLFRVSPVLPIELVMGKVLAYLLLGGIVAVTSLALLVGFLGVPMLGHAALIAGVVALLLLASLGLGFLISVVSDSERQAVQLSLLALLASMFFSGFVLRVDEFTEPVQAVAQALPVTHGIRLLQDLMLRGGIIHVWQLGALAAIAAILLLTSSLLLRREMRPT